MTMMTTTTTTRKQQQLKLKLKLKLYSRPFISLVGVVVVCYLLSHSQAQPIAQEVQHQQPQPNFAGQPQLQPAAAATALDHNQQQQASGILASIVNSAAQRQSAAAPIQQPDVAATSAAANQQFLNAAAQFGSSILGSKEQLNGLLANGTGNINYREQGELLRQEILRRAGHLQQVVASSHEMIKNSGDLIVARLLDQLNQRLNVAKSKADKIINEPATNEVALRALGTINQGLNNVNNIIQNIVNQNRSKLNFQQISRQFSTALTAVQKQLNSQQLQQQQQQLQQLQQLQQKQQLT